MRQSPNQLSRPPDKKKRVASAEPTVPRTIAKRGVLVVDDDHMVRVMLQLGLERNGFDVWLARNGREAIDLHRRHTDEIAVVLLDVDMPGLDGFQVLEVLREVNPEVLACFMSRDTGLCEPEERLQRGAAYVFAKPFHLVDLVNILRPMAQGVPADSLASARLVKPPENSVITHTIGRKCTRSS